MVPGSERGGPVSQELPVCSNLGPTLERQCWSDFRAIEFLLHDERLQLPVLQVCPCRLANRCLAQVSRIRHRARFGTWNIVRGPPIRAARGPLTPTPFRTSRRKQREIGE